MRVFVTGATGYIGTAVIAELVGAGHTVLGVARTDEGAKALASRGVEVHRPTLDDVFLTMTGRSLRDEDAVPAPEAEKEVVA